MQSVYTNERDRSVNTLTTEERWKLRESQTINYDPDAIKALILSACGLEPSRGTEAADQWRLKSNRIFNHELDLLRAAHGASAGQAVTFKPIAEHVGD